MAMPLLTKSVFGKRPFLDAIASSSSWCCQSASGPVIHNFRFASSVSPVSPVSSVSSVSPVSHVSSVSLVSLVSPVSLVSTVSTVETVGPVALVFLILQPFPIKIPIKVEKKITNIGRKGPRAKQKQF